MTQYQKLVILLLLLACITASASADMSQSSCEARGGWYGDVYSNPAAGLNEVTTPILDNGRIYSITAIETFWVDLSRDIRADAQFYSADEWSTWDKPEFPPGTIHSFLQINNNDVNWGDTPNLDLATYHEYTVQFLGQGSPVTLRIKDWYDNNYDNNYCHIPVCIIPDPVLVPEFPSPYLPAVATIGFLGAVFLIKRTREN